MKARGSTTQIKLKKSFHCVCSMLQIGDGLTQQLTLQTQNIKDWKITTLRILFFFQNDMLYCFEGFFEVYLIKMKVILIK